MPRNPLSSLTSAQARLGFTLIELLLVCVIIGVLGSMSVASYRNMLDNANNASAASNAREVAVALEHYRSDRSKLPHGLNGIDGAQVYLLSGAFATPYLPSNKLPRSPWGAIPQTGTDVAIPSNSVDGVKAAGTTKIKSCMGLDFGLGTLPTSPNYTQNTYGLIQYGPNANRDIYAVTVVGKRKRNAVIVGAFSNAN